MRAAALAFAILVACSSGEPEHTLSLDGPVRVRVDSLGPVEGPRVIGPEGIEPEGVVWSVEPPHVARIVDGQVVAVGRGEALVVGSWEGDAVQWELVVEPAVSLSFVDPPAQIQVGETRALRVQAMIGGEPAIPVKLDWSARPGDVVAVDEGRLEGLSTGLAWVTARHGPSEAMVEIRVVDGE